jgi:hypothetical protein
LRKTRLKSVSAPQARSFAASDGAGGAPPDGNFGVLIHSS